MNNHRGFVCDTNNLQDVYELSHLCWNDYSTNQALPCFPKSFKEHFDYAQRSIRVSLSGGIQLI